MHAKALHFGINPANMFKNSIMLPGMCHLTVGGAIIEETALSCHHYSLRETQLRDHKHYQKEWKLSFSG